ncbi:hypothetical protein F5Y12DRAFT_780836 [Xylaria sp. FL1777]|nr:hypothetical protein F5Y12DRAFT_780836 [Xylaria sp. FL1777]
MFNILQHLFLLFIIIFFNVYFFICIIDIFLKYYSFYMVFYTALLHFITFISLVYCYIF